MSTNNVLSCKVCMDANKPKSVYSSHRVKQNGVVVCPTLLSQECKYCHKKGHTVKFCSVLEKENERKKNQLADGSAVKSALRSADDHKKTQRVGFTDPISTTNRFRVLEEKDDWNAGLCLTDIVAPALNETPRVKDEFPPLCNNIIVNAATLGGYATALKTQTPQKFIPRTFIKTQTKTQIQIQPPTKTQTPTETKAQTETHKKLFATYDPTQKKSWANCNSDSEDSDDEEETKEEVAGTCAW